MATDAAVEVANGDRRTRGAESGARPFVSPRLDRKPPDET